MCQTLFTVAAGPWNKVTGMKDSPLYYKTGLVNRVHISELVLNEIQEEEKKKKNVSNKSTYRHSKC